MRFSDSLSVDYLTLHKKCPVRWVIRRIIHQETGKEPWRVAANTVLRDFERGMLSVDYHERFTMDDDSLTGFPSQNDGSDDEEAPERLYDSVREEDEDDDPEWTELGDIYGVVNENDIMQVSMASTTASSTNQGFAELESEIASFVTQVSALVDVPCQNPAVVEDNDDSKLSDFEKVLLKARIGMQKRVFSNEQSEFVVGLLSSVVDALGDKDGEPLFGPRNWTIPVSRSFSFLTIALAWLELSHEIWVVSTFPSLSS